VGMEDLDIHTLESDTVPDACNIIAPTKNTMTCGEGKVEC